jgi:hypothetical protein
VTRKVVLMAAAAVLLAGCSGKAFLRAAENAMNHGTVGWPRYPDARVPPALGSAAPEIAPRDVVLVFPEIDNLQVVHWNATEDFRVVLPRTPAAVKQRLPPAERAVRVGELRTRDRALSDVEYQALRCGFGRTWDGPRFNPKEFLVPAFCDGGDPSTSREATVDLVDATLDELRASAARAGANVVTEISCYTAVNRKRLWCEAIAVVAR